MKWLFHAAASATLTGINYRKAHIFQAVADTDAELILFTPLDDQAEHGSFANLL